MADPRAASLVRGCDYFSKQPDSFAEDLGKLLKEEKIADGEILLNEGSPVERLMILEQGELQRIKSIPGKKNETTYIDSIEEGTPVCMLHVLSADESEKSASFATVISKGKSTIWSVPTTKLMELISSNPAYALAMMNVLALEMRKCSKIIRAMNAVGSQMEQRGGRSQSVLVRRTSHLHVDQQVFKVLCYDATGWARTNFSKQLEEFNKSATTRIVMSYTTDRCSHESAGNAVGNDAVCLFVNDQADHDTLLRLSMGGVKMIAMRCAGYDRVDKQTAESLGLTVARVPAYSPYAVAEHAITLLMSLNRKLDKASRRIHDGNFTLDGLVGFDLHGKTVGVVGTGRIGQCLCNILLGFGVTLKCFDMYQSQDLKDRGANYVEMEEIWRTSDVLFLMTPLLDSTKHMFNHSILPKLKKGVFLINTSRGGLIDTEALLEGLRKGIVGGAGLDVYEHEEAYFFNDRSQEQVIEDKVLAELLSFRNVILTAHQAFFTQEAVHAIVSTTIENMKLYIEGKRGRDHPNSIYS